MERRNFQFKTVISRLQNKKSKALTNPDYQECLEIRRKFLEYDIHQVDNFTWRLVNDFIDCSEIGWYVRKQVTKVHEAILKYSTESTFWTELELSSRQRKQETNRLAILRIEARKALKEGGLKREIRKELSNFKGWAYDVRKKLLKDPLSIDQWKVIWKIERILGIYYIDLTEEQNGIFVKKEEK